ncbi:hypothetical protein ACVBEQ_13405 [Nakamurella sp. GG22]
MRIARVAAALTLALSAVLLSGTPAGAASPIQQAVDRTVAAAFDDGIQQSVAVVDRSSGERVAASSGDEQYISESIVKLFTVAYYEVQAGGHPDQEMAQTLRSMIINSDDRIESSLWNTDIVPSMAERYGLSHTSNGPKTGPHDWGWELITADDEANFLYSMSNDPAVAPLLMDAMADVAPVGADGFDQSFGLNALSGDHGSKQGWTDVGSSDDIQIHSVGWTDRYFVAVLETSTGAGYDAMRAASTATAEAIQAAEGPVQGAGDAAQAAAAASAAVESRAAAAQSAAESAAAESAARESAAEESAAAEFAAAAAQVDADLQVMLGEIATVLAHLAP